MLLISVLFPIVAGVAVSVPAMSRRLRQGLYTAVIVLTDLFGVLTILLGRPVTLFRLTGDISLAFSLDEVGRFFLILVLTVYTAATIYAFEYLEHDDRMNQFFGFWFASLGAMTAACLAANLVSLYLCFEMATLTSMPLVLYERTKEATLGALKYLFYSIGGALVGLFAVMTLCYYGFGVFALGGFLSADAMAAQGPLLRAAAFVGIVGFGAKAGMYPLHGWLPAAHPVAPAPASALLSGIVAKAGILAVIRLVYFSVGPELIRGTWVQLAWMILALLTVFMGSMMAYLEKVTKKRLAYSTVSQLSYIMLGLSLLCDGGLHGALLHAAAHAVSKGTLFLCAGVFIHKLGRHNVSELRGIGRQMPVTLWCFLIASLSLVGIPPLGGFVSKWSLALTALETAPGAFAVLIPVVLLLSALLTAGYLLPIVVNGFFPSGDEDLPVQKEEPSVLMTGPMIALGCCAWLAGLFGSAWMP